MERHYKWEVIESKTTFKNECDFIEFELQLDHYGIRTRVQVSEKGHLELWVPMKDAEIARAVITNEVKEIICEPKESYREFDERLNFRNKRLYQNKYKINLNIMTARRYGWLGLMVLILLLLFRFFRF